MTMVSSYFAKVGVDVNKADFARVDKYFDGLQRRLLKFQTATGKLTVDVKPTVNVPAAAKTLSRLMNAAMKDVTIPLRKFSIDGKALSNQISGSLATKGGSSRIRLNATLSSQSLQAMRQQVQAALSGMIISPRVRPVVSPTRGLGGSGTAPSNSSGRGARGKTPNQQSMALNASGGAYGGLAAFSRFGLASLPFFAGAYGFSALNSATQAATLTDMSSKGIFSAATMPDGSVRNVYDNSNAWIREHANATGSNLQNILPSYQGFMAGSMPTMGYEPSQAIFKAFSQFGTVRGATKESMQRGLTAVSQMAGKGQVMSEELKGQLAEAQGFGELPQIFAAAYQKQTGGKLVGSKAYTALLDAMKDGKVKSADILPAVSEILRQKSDPYISAAANTSAGWQNRAANNRFEFTEKFAKGGGDKGLAILWQTISEMTERASKYAETFGKYFQVASLYASDLLLYLEEYGSFLTGNGDGSLFVSLFGDRNGELFKNLLNTVKENLSQIFGLFKGISDSSGFKSFLDSILNSILNIATGLQQIFSAAIALAKGDFSGAWANTKMAATSLYYGVAYDDRGIKAANAASAANAAPVGMPNSFQFGSSPTAYSSSAAVNNTTSANVNIYNPTITAAPGQTVPQAMAELTNGVMQQNAFNQTLRSTLANAPKGPQ